MNFIIEHIFCLLLALASPFICFHWAAESKSVFPILLFLIGLPLLVMFIGMREDQDYAASLKKSKEKIEEIHLKEKIKELESRNNFLENKIKEIANIL